MTAQAETTLPRDMSVLAYRDPFPVAGMARTDPPSHPVSTAPVTGQRMPDGTVYAGISPSSGRPMFAAPNDVKLRIDWFAARNYADTLDAHGHNDWRVPTPAELNTVFNNRAAIGNFDETGVSYQTSESSEEKFYGFAIFARAQRFSDGFRNRGYHKGSVAALRCVRG